MVDLNSIFESYPDQLFLIADGFDSAIIGVDDTQMRLIYSINKCIEILQADMSYDDAVEHFMCNVQGAYVGEQTPIWCNDQF